MAKLILNYISITIKILLYSQRIRLNKCIWFFAIPCTIAHQAPLSMGFSTQAYWSGSVHQFGGSVMSDFLPHHESQHARPPCPSPTPGVHSDSRPSSQWCHPAISSSVITFSSCPQSFPASESFPVSQLSSTGGQSIGVSVSASVFPVNIQDCFPLGLTGLILQS